MKIIKRDGHIVDYCPEKIEIAIKKANKEVPEEERVSDIQIKNIIKYIEGLKKRRMLVEDIQDIIEMRFGLINYSHPFDVDEICEKYHFSKTRFTIIYHTAIRQLSWYMKYSNMTNFYRFEEVLNHERL